MQVSRIRFLGSPQASAHGSPNRRHPVWRITLLSPPRLAVVQDPGCRQRQLAMYRIDTLRPVEVALGAASAQPVLPRSLGIREDRVEPLAMATDTIVWVRATQLRAPGPILLLEWRLAILSTPCPSPLHKPAPALPDRLPLDDPVSPARRGPRVGQSQQVACPRAPCRGGAVWRPLERTHHRRCGMHGPAKALTALRPDVQDPVGVRVSREAEEKILGKTRHNAPALHPGLPHLDTPCVQDILQEYVSS